MPVDESWLALTKLYAIVSLASLGILILGLIYLGVRIQRLVKVSKAMPKMVSDRSKRTADLVRGRGQSLVTRGRKLGETCRASFERIAEKLRGARDLLGE